MKTNIIIFEMVLHHDEMLETFTYHIILTSHLALNHYLRRNRNELSRVANGKITNKLRKFEK